MAKKRQPHEPRVAPPAPSRVEVEERLRGVVEGRLSRDEADRWAMQWVAADDPGVEDRLVWDALMKLAGIDLPDLDGGLLHDDEQVAEWLEQFRQARSQLPRRDG